MKSSLFTQLFKYKESDKVAPRENFITEIFTFVLENDENVRDLFFKMIRFKEGKSLNINTQSTYIYGRPDIDIQDEDSIILVENKVEEQERPSQLFDYCQILKMSKKKTKILIYITKYYEQKDIVEDEIKFYNFRWHDLAAITKNTTNLVTKEFYKYLKEQGMSEGKNFNAFDLVSLQSISGTISKMDEVLNGISPYCEEKLGKFSKKSSRSTRLSGGSYANSKDYYAPTYQFTITIGFAWWWNDGHSYLMLHIWLPTKNESNNQSKKLFRKLLENWTTFEVEKNEGFEKKVNILGFMEQDDQIPAMIGFLKEGIDEIYKLRLKFPEQFGDITIDKNEDNKL